MEQTPRKYPGWHGYGPSGAENVQRVIERIELELEKLQAKFESFASQRERIFLKAEIVHLGKIKRDLRRKPPEAGLPVPAISPKGPLPKQGGAEAPLEFDRD